MIELVVLPYLYARLESFVLKYLLISAMITVRIPIRISERTDDPDQAFADQSSFTESVTRDQLIGQLIPSRLFTHK